MIHGKFKLCYKIRGFSIFEKLFLTWAKKVIKCRVNVSSAMNLIYMLRNPKWKMTN